LNSINQHGGENSAFDMAGQESADTDSGQEEIAALPESSENTEDAGTNSFMDQSTEESTLLKAEPSDKTNVYQADLLQYDLFTFGLVTPDAISVPVSLMVEKKETGNWVERFTEVSQSIPEQDWGFEDYFPLPGSVAEDKETGQLTYTVTDDELNNSGGGEELLYESLLFALEASPYDKIMLRKSDGSVPSFSHMGKISEINIADQAKKAYYQYTHENGDIFLVPGEAAFESISEALTAMKSSPNDDFEPIIAKDIELTSTSKNKLLTISFKEEPTMNDARLLLIEGILMTAKEFGFDEVLFQNLGSATWEGFDLSKPVSVPVSPNKKILN
ncbi:RsiX, partial [Bacillus sp. SG-1]